MKFPLTETNNKINQKDKNVTLDLNNFGFLNKNKLGKTKQSTPASKEWSSSMYYFNKATLKNISNKKHIIDNIINSYFSLDSFYKLKRNPAAKKLKAVTKKNRIKRKSLTKILISSSEIKHFADKAIINFSILDKEKEAISKKIYFYMSSLKKHFLSKGYPSIDNYFNSYYNNRSSTIGRNFANKLEHRKKFAKWIPNKVFLKTSLANKKLAYNLLVKKTFFKNIFIFLFLKWALSSINIFVYLKNTHKSKILIIENKSIGNNIKALNLTNKSFLLNIKKVNTLLLNLLVRSLTILEVEHKNILLNEMFNSFKTKYFLLFYKKYLKKQILGVHYLFLNSLNNFKFTKLISGLKVIANKILNKKIELNITNIKYLHLDADIFSKAISIKLNKKNSRLLKVLKRSLKLIKLPRDNIIKNNSKVNLNYKDVDINLFNINNNSKDLIDNVIYYLFPLKNKFSLDKLNILSQIKNKWVKGVRVEARGRLTKRYTASRSVFKYKYKGDLRDNIVKNASVMSRGDLRSNLLYKSIKSNRRIGAFGIKGWISTK